MKKLAEIAAAAAMAAGLAPTMASAAVVLDAQGHAAVEGAVVKARGGEPGAAWTLIDWRSARTGGTGATGGTGERTGGTGERTGGTGGTGATCGTTASPARPASPASP